MVSANGWLVHKANAEPNRQFDDLRGRTICSQFHNDWVYLSLPVGTVLDGRWHVSSTETFPRFIHRRRKFVAQKSGVGKLKHVTTMHMFLQQLLRQKVFATNKTPTRVNPWDLNTKKLIVERRKLLSVPCGLYPLCVQTEDEEETLMSRRVHRNVASKLAQALQVSSIGLLQGCLWQCFDRAVTTWWRVVWWTISTTRSTWWGQMQYWLCHWFFAACTLEDDLHHGGGKCNIGFVTGSLQHAPWKTTWTSTEWTSATRWW